ncbi:MAG TPA: type II secretion system protein N [Gammaproteobacteria bacterium]|nr:type II secretion system protein N [Gammaproteobacteria bacterium]
MSWRRIALFTGVGLFAYVLFLALTLPASLLFGYLLPPRSPISIVASHGTPWHGEADQLVVNGSALGRLSWSVHPWTLFTGRLDYDLRLHGAMTQLTGEAVLTPGGKIVVTNLNGPFDLATALKWLQLPPGSATGRLRLQLDQFVFEGRTPTTLEGRVTLDHLSALWPQPMQLGGYLATFTTDDNGIHGRARDTGGPIDLDATIDIQKNGRYRAQGTLTPRGNADPSLKQALQFLGRTDKGGTTRFSFGGSLAL